MEKNKKMIVIISIVAVLVILAIVGGIIFWNNQTAKTEEENQERLSNFANTIRDKQVYSVDLKSVETGNAMFYAKNNNMAFVRNNIDGRESKAVVKDGSTYLIVDDQKEVYVYQNNEVDLNKMIVEIDDILTRELTTGKAKVLNKQYQYQEVEGVTSFVINDFSTMENVKTRFYFEKDQLKYIETISGDVKEILEVTISDKVDNNLFNIPSDYEEK